MRSSRTAVGVLVVAFLLVFGASAAHAQYDNEEGTLETSGTATAGGTINVSGTCFAANADVEISVDGTVVKTVKADATGTISTSVTIPADASGSIVIRATGLTTDGATCVLSTTVTVSATGAAASPTASSGTRLPVTGTEVTPGFLVTAIVLLAVGAGMVLIARRRRSSTTSA